MVIKLTHGKKVKITSIFKNGNKSDPANYRPISSALQNNGKVNQKRNVRTNNNLVASEQHGFVNNKSCLTNLLETVDIITDTIDSGSGHRLLVVFLQFAKAFYKVCDKSLLSKSKTYGFDTRIV